MAQNETLVIRSEQSAPNLPPRWRAQVIRSGSAVAIGAVMGTGPFRIMNFDPGKRVVLAANTNYWAGRPYLDSVEIEMGRSPRDQSLDFDLNKADLVELGIGDARRVSQNGRKAWTSAPAESAGRWFLSPPADPHVREAIAEAGPRPARPASAAYGLDRRAIDRESNGFAHVRVAGGLKNQRQQIGRRRSPGLAAVLRNAPRIADSQLDKVGFIQIEVERLSRGLRPISISTESRYGRPAQ